MVKMMMALAAVCVLATGYVATNAMAEEDIVVETYGDEFTSETEHMSDESSAEFESEVDCTAEVMEGEEPPEECLSQDNEDDSETIVIDEEIIE